MRQTISTACIFSADVRLRKRICLWIECNGIVCSIRGSASLDQQHGAADLRPVRARDDGGNGSRFGSAKTGVEHWLAQRVSAVALVPLTLWFVASIISHTGSGYVSFVTWLQTSAAMILTISILIFLFHHTALGLQVVIEDYVHSGARFAAVIAVRLC
ncbi:succinate dehydrogenase, hydrophobic membrane anchor protein [Pseudorhodoplanes sp.]|uniref:succinate dehydrogenase, hydrophobic membrane anchor protein n=1 Tax=Pseudorhodoplanes sp. TaxID=1934341 RepID=UPI003D10E1E4